MDAPRTLQELGWDDERRREFGEVAGEGRLPGRVCRIRS